MSSLNFRGLARVALVAGLSLGLSACFRPLHGPTASGQSLQTMLASIEVPEVQWPDTYARFGHYLRSELGSTVRCATRASVTRGVLHRLRDDRVDAVTCERQMARSHPGAQVDALNLFTLCSRASPHWRQRDKLVETLGRKFERFVLPAINGRDITNDIHIDRRIAPPFPVTYETLRDYELGGARLGLAVLSTVSSLTTIQSPCSLEEYGPVLEPAWRTAHLSLRIGQAVRALGYDKVVMFIRRHCYSRPFWDGVE